jgi:hypothetical protein
MGAYVALLEYNGIEGMILLSELSRRRIRSISKLIKVGRQEPVMVLRVDKEKGYIDLSKRRVSPVSPSPPPCPLPLAANSTLLSYHRVHHHASPWLTYHAHRRAASSCGSLWLSHDGHTEGLGTPTCSVRTTGCSERPRGRKRRGTGETSVGLTGDPQRVVWRRRLCTHSPV